MDKLIKFFPFMPAEKEVGKFILALAFYLLVPTPVAGIIGFVLGLTIILAPVGIIVGFVLGIYGLMGAVLALLSFLGHDIAGKKEEN